MAPIRSKETKKEKKKEKEKRNHPNGELPAVCNTANRWVRHLAAASVKVLLCTKTQSTKESIGPEAGRIAGCLTLNKKKHSKLLFLIERQYSTVCETAFPSFPATFSDISNR